MRRPQPSRPRSPRAAAVLLCAGLATALLAAPPALADAPRRRLTEGEVALEYIRGAGAAGCPDEAALRERSADAFEFRDPFLRTPNAEAPRMRIEITRQGKVFRGAVQVLDPAGQVTAATSEEHVNCDALVWVLAHRMALAVFRRKPPPTAPPPPPVPAVTAPPPAAAEPLPAPEPAKPASPAPRCGERCLDDLARRTAMTRPGPVFLKELSLGAAARLDLTEQPGVGLWAGLGLHRSSFFGWFELRGSLPATALTFAEGRTSAVSTVTALAAGCARRDLLFLCALGELGVLVYELPLRDRVQVGIIGAVGPRFGANVPLGRGFALRVASDLLIRPQVPVFSLLVREDGEDTRTTWRTPTVGFVMSAGFSWSI